VREEARGAGSFVYDEFSTMWCFDTLNTVLFS